MSLPWRKLDGQYLHRDIFEMAAAYGFHLCKNHPFVDGNKRIALVAMDTFLQLNGLELLAGEKETYMMILQLAASELTKQELTLITYPHSFKSNPHHRCRCLTPDTNLSSVLGPPSFSFYDNDSKILTYLLE
ncbi:MAG: type II toxin-antitoxin system death-on-curing family toxin [Syntrophomonadaceae bacterium]|nr:type II toxin-antitoxin system death-on-curing family toxin [Syntrophomonadaceae bacterium]